MDIYSIVMGLNNGYIIFCITLPMFVGGIFANCIGYDKFPYNVCISIMFTILINLLFIYNDWVIIP